MNRFCPRIRRHEPICHVLDFQSQAKGWGAHPNAQMTNVTLANPKNLGSLIIGQVLFIEVLGESVHAKILHMVDTCSQYTL